MNKIKKIIVSTLLLLSLGGFFLGNANTASAANYYYDSKSGNYVIPVKNQCVSGKDLNSWPAKVPGSDYNKMRKAAIKKYGKIENKKKYYFSYKNVVRPYGKYGGSSYTGKIVDMKCTGRK